MDISLSAAAPRSVSPSLSWETLITSPGLHARVGASPPLPSPPLESSRQPHLLLGFLRLCVGCSPPLPLPRLLALLLALRSRCLSPFRAPTVDLIIRDSVYWGGVFAHKVFDKMPPAGLLARQAVSTRAHALAWSLRPPLGAAARLLHGGGETGGADFPYADVPRPGRKWERKPYVTPMKVLIRRAKEERRARLENPCRVLEHPPGNGLLVPHLVKVAHQVHSARERLLDGLIRLINGNAAIPVKRCRFCSEVHIGSVGHEIRTCEGAKSGSRNSLHVWRLGTVRDIVGFPYCYHLFDRVGKPRVVHKEKYDVPRLPAILELCIQAGVDVERYPTKRRTRPVYSIEGRIADFEPDEEDNSEAETSPEPSSCSSLPSEEAPMSCNSARDGDEHQQEKITVSELSSRTLQSWLDMRSGAASLMSKYGVLTCGYCPEVQVGPKGHKVRMCKATKHQQRDGQHAWQEATVDDLVRPNYVWHVRDPAVNDGIPLANELKRYYGKAPAVVELCVRAGAPVPTQYRSMMRLDVVPPAYDEFDLVA